MDCRSYNVDNQLLTEVIYQVKSTNTGTLSMSIFNYFILLFYSDLLDN